jgi:putative ABC transport system substrate-binding protein
MEDAMKRVARLWRYHARRAAFLVGFRILASLAVLASASCTGALPAPSGKLGAASFTDPPRRPNRPLVMLAMPDSEAFRAVRRTLVAEVKKDFDVKTEVVGMRTTPAEFSALVERNRPQCVVLMDNPTVKLYREYQHNRRAPGPPPPAVVVMSSFLEEVRSELANASGVAYEVPGVTAFVNLRSVIEKPVTRVGVVHRPAFRRFLDRQKVLAAREQITLVPVEVPTAPSALDLRSALRSLHDAGQIDALWVLNDNVLLRDARFLETAWRPAVANLGVPVVVGVPTLVTAEARLGTFAVLPDLDALGVQAANLVFEVADSDWRADGHPVELPISTVTVVNMRQLREKFGLREGASRRIDKALE